MNGTQKITPFLWFDDAAEEAARTYTSIFKDSSLGEVSRYSSESAEVGGRPAGSVMTVSFHVTGHRITALNGGPLYRFSPAASFFVSCADVGEAGAVFARLAEGGTMLMPFQPYPFSDGFGWVEDRFGLSWQVNAAPRVQVIAPALTFVGRQCGRAEEAMRLYTSLFDGSGIGEVWRYAGDEGPDAAGTVKQAVFSLAGCEFRAMDSAHDHQFTFTEAMSFQVHCVDQAEIDHYWGPLTEGGDPAAQQCGWLKDRFGVSWQIVPKVLFDMLSDSNAEKAGRATNAFLKMKKFDIAALERAFDGP